MDNELTPLNPPTPEPASVAPILPPPKKNFLPLILLLLLAFILGLVYFGFRLLSQTTKPVLSPSPSPSPAATAAPLSLDPVPNAANLLAYLRNPNPGQFTKLEVWLLDPITGQEQRLPLSNTLEAYKYYGSSLLFVRPDSPAGEYQHIDLETGLITSHTPVTHPDPSASKSFSLDNIHEISPDGKWLVVQVGFYTPCPSPSPLPSGFEGGFGPCGPDESLDTPAGDYLYNLTTRQAVHLPDYFRAARWDLDNDYFYYSSQQATKQVNLSSLTVADIDASPHFAYFTYPLLKLDRLLKYEAGTAESASTDQDFTKLYLYNRQDGSEQIIESVDTWADIQPFLTASPDERYILYVRTYRVNRVGINALYRYDTETKETSRLTPDNNSTQYSIYGAWLDSTTFVTSADVVESDNYTNANQNLVKLNVETGELTPLTTHSQVYRFLSN